MGWGLSKVATMCVGSSLCMTSRRVLRKPRIGPVLIPVEVRGGFL